MVKEQKEYNVLILGETQSGKSTLVEFLSAYSDPNYTIKQENVGDGVFSKTDNVKTTTVHTDFPSYFVTTKAGEQVNYGQFIQQEDQDDYEDELNERRRYRLQRGEPTTDSATFNLIDTPGLNDTSKFNESNIATIFKALDAIKSVHLVVITIANNPFTEGLRNALKAYIDLLPEFNRIFVFVHTKIDYARLHHKERHFVQMITEKKSMLHDLAGRDSVPHLLIDNDIKSKKTIRNCITQNTLRELLAMAKLNQPVPLQIMVMNKTEKMRMVDLSLKERLEDVIAKREAALGAKDRKQEAVLVNINELRAKIDKHKNALDDIDRDRSYNARDTLVLLHEERYDQNWGLLKLAEPKIRMYYPERELSEKLNFPHHIIDHVDTQAYNVKVGKQDGGVGHNFWGINFLRNRFQNGKFHVKIYIQKRKEQAALLEELKARDRMTRGLLEHCVQNLQRLERDRKEDMEDMEELLKDLEKDRYVHSRVSMTSLDIKVFHALVEAKVFVFHIHASANNLEKFYIEQRDWLEKVENTKDYVDPKPLNNSEATNDGIILDQ